MTSIHDLFDTSLFERCLEEKLVSARRHEQLPLTVYNYTKTAQYTRAWNEVTLTCRGLIVDDDGTVVARPLEKFFNHDEYEATIGPLPQEPFTVWDKLDGSLFVVARYNGQLVTATRGSFYSPQAEAGRDLIAKHDTSGLVEGTTYLFEVVHPTSRVVVSYPFSDVVLLTSRDTDTGTETLPDDPSLDHLPFRRAARIDAATLDELVAEAETSGSAAVEGFIVRYESGLRVKVKYDEYKRLHRLLTGVNPKVVWELISQGRTLDQLIEQVPDEFYSWLTATAQSLTDAYQARHDEVEKTLDRHRHLAGDRRVFAESLFAATKHDPGLGHLAMRLHDGRDITKPIWDHVKPRGDQAAFFEDDAA